MSHVHAVGRCFKDRARSRCHILQVVLKLGSVLGDTAASWSLMEWSMGLLAEGGMPPERAGQLLAIVDSAAQTAGSPSAAARLCTFLDAISGRHAAPFLMFTFQQERCDVALSPAALE